MKLTRRKALALGLGALLAIPPDTPRQPTQADNLFDSFPEFIPGAAGIHKFKHPFAQTCLVHIAQEHYVDTPGLSFEQRLQHIRHHPNLDQRIIQIYQSTNAVQKNISDILSFLTIHYAHFDVHGEGITGTEPVHRQSATNEYFTRLQELDNLHVLGYSIKSAYQTIIHLEDYVRNGDGRPFSNPEQTLAEYTRAQKEFAAVKYIPGADWLLAREGKITLLPCETNESMQGDAMDIAVHERREDTSLSIVSKYGKPLAFLVYGRAHNFADTVERWNAKNPIYRYSLIRIDPKEI